MEDLKNVTKALKPYLRKYLEDSGVKFKSYNSIHCPFTQDHAKGDRDASAGLYEGGERFNCFGCGRNRDIVHMCMDLENLTFVDAVRRLCERFGIQHNIKYEKHIRSQLLEDICSYIAKKGSTRIANERGIPTNICKGYGIGTVSASKVKELAAKYSNEEKLRTGLWKRSDSGSVELLSLMGKDILSFAIRDVIGCAVGVVGRRNFKPKYLDPAGNKFSNKDVPYGMDRAIHRIRERKECTIVEGYTDVIQLHMHDYGNTVGVRGRTPTDRQISMITDLGAETISLMLDNDDTGRAATLNILSKHYVEGQYPQTKFTVIEYPTRWKDPDDFARKDRFIKTKMQKRDGLLYLIENMPRGINAECDSAEDMASVAANHAMIMLQVGIYAKAIALKYNADYKDVRRRIMQKWIKKQ